jgi:hypothetical protein
MVMNAALLMDLTNYKIKLILKPVTKLNLARLTSFKVIYIKFMNNQ